MKALHEQEDEKCTFVTANLQIDFNLNNILNTYPSKLLENAVIELSRLPGVGRKTALRLALYLLKKEVSEVESFGNAILKMRKEILFCERCHNISDTTICPICAN